MASLIGDGGCGDFWVERYNVSDPSSVLSLAQVNREVFNLCRSYTTQVCIMCVKFAVPEEPPFIAAIGCVGSRPVEAVGPIFQFLVMFSPVTSRVC